MPIGTFIENPSHLVSDHGHLKRASATWLLKIKEKHKLSQVALQGMIEHVTDLFQAYLCDLHNNVKQHLENSGVDESSITSLDPLFDSDGYYGRPFKGLETEYRQLKYFKENFHMVVRSSNT